MQRTAKVFMDGRSQAVRLPSDFRFGQSEVYIRRDEATGDVVLSQKHRTLENFFKLLDESGPADQDFLVQRD